MTLACHVHRSGDAKLDTRPLKQFLSYAPRSAVQPTSALAPQRLGRRAGVGIQRVPGADAMDSTAHAADCADADWNVFRKAADAFGLQAERVDLLSADGVEAAFETPAILGREHSSATRTGSSLTRRISSPTWPCGIKCRASPTTAATLPRR